MSSLPAEATDQTAAQPISVREALEKAVGHHQAGRLDEAGKIYSEILSVQPGHPDALHLLGVATGQVGDLRTAVQLIRRAIAVQPRHADCHSNLGKFLMELGHEQTAIASYRRAIKLRPNLAIAHLNLGVALQTRDQLDSAIESFRRAIDLEPDYAEAYSNLGVALKSQGHLDAAADSFRKALSINPEFADANWNLALLQLLRGNFSEGWPHYERRLRFEENAHLTRQFTQPQWQGEPSDGRTILLIAEQGFGDSIQFIRYAPLIARRGGKVMVWTRPELKRLFGQVEGVDLVLGDHDEFPPFDFQCPLLSLPRIFGTTLQNIPAKIPYISPDAQLVQQWSQRFASADRRRRIGLAWAGSPTHKSDRVRSISPASLAPLATVKNTSYYSLQKGDAAAQGHFLPPELALTDWTKDLTDFADTAALIANLDMVVSVDTAVAHLAGAMGKPVWLMLPFMLDWRWLVDRADSPWYPTMRLFRQSSRGDWKAVIAAVASQL